VAYHAAVQLRKALGQVLGGLEALAHPLDETGEGEEGHAIGSLECGQSLQRLLAGRDVLLGMG